MLFRVFLYQGGELAAYLAGFVKQIIILAPLLIYLRRKMCGFQVLINPSEDVERVDLERISLDFAYRGPDFSGFYSYDKIHFVHNRLSIIDTSDSSNQPILDHTGRYVLVFNGEIYNFESLYDTYLDNENFCFRESDVGPFVPVNPKGECALELLDGMFGFVFYDKELDQFIVGRDWFGEKPLYYSDSHNGLNFASDLKFKVLFRFRFKRCFPRRDSFFVV